MKHTKEEILNALQIIQDECIDTDCRECPFGNTAHCCMMRDEYPLHWNIKTKKETVWRAFES